MEPRRILIIEDDPAISSQLQAHLNGLGYEAERVTDFRRVMETFAQLAPHLVLMDISLPHHTGFYYCALIRETSKTPVIFITSAGDAMNLVTAINLGADDLIAKPFELPVLTAKIQALLRRSYDFSSAEAAAAYKGVALSPDDASCLVNGARLELTRNEYRILSMLMASPGKVVSREALMEGLWATDSFVDENTLSVNVSRLRRKLEAAGVEDFIATRKGMGYII